MIDNLNSQLILSTNINTSTSEETCYECLYPPSTEPVYEWTNKNPNEDYCKDIRYVREACNVDPSCWRCELTTPGNTTLIAYAYREEPYETNPFKCEVIRTATTKSSCKNEAKKEGLTFIRVANSLEPVN